MYVLCENRYYRDKISYGKYTLEKWKWSDFANDKSANREEITSDISNDAINQYLLDNGIILNREVKLIFNNSLGVYLISNKWCNSIFPESPIGDSIYLGIEDLLATLDNALTSKEVDKYLGRGRVIVPKAMQSGIQQANVGQKAVLERLTQSMQSGTNVQTLVQTTNGNGTLLDNTFFTRSGRWVRSKQAYATDKYSNEFKN